MVKSKLPLQSGCSLDAIEPHPYKGAKKIFFAKYFLNQFPSGTAFNSRIFVSMNFHPEKHYVIYKAGQWFRFSKKFCIRKEYDGQNTKNR